MKTMTYTFVASLMLAGSASVLPQPSYPDAIRASPALNDYVAKHNRPHMPSHTGCNIGPITKVEKLKYTIDIVFTTYFPYDHGHHNVSVTQQEVDVVVRFADGTYNLWFGEGPLHGTVEHPNGAAAAIGPIFPPFVPTQKGIQLNPEATGFTLKAGQMGFLQERCGTAYPGAKPAREQLGTFHSYDEKVATCEFVDVTQQVDPQICGGIICHQQFTAGEPGTTMVTNDRSNRVYKITVTK